MNVNIGDVAKAADMLGATRNPGGFVRDVLGFTEAEAKAGVPSWAWFVLGVGAGVFVARAAAKKGVL